VYLVWLEWHRHAKLGANDSLSSLAIPVSLFGMIVRVDKRDLFLSATPTLHTPKRLGLNQNWDGKMQTNMVQWSTWKTASRYFSLSSWPQKRSIELDRAPRQHMILMAPKLLEVWGDNKILYLVMVAVIRLLDKATSCEGHGGKCHNNCCKTWTVSNNSVTNENLMQQSVGKPELPMNVKKRTC